MGSSNACWLLALNFYPVHAMVQERCFSRQSPRILFLRFVAKISIFRALLNFSAFVFFVIFLFLSFRCHAL